MINEWVSMIENAAMAKILRNSLWPYPIVNAGHILGISLLVGGIVPLDLRILGIWKHIHLRPLWKVLKITSLTGLILLIFCGFLLFITRASQYVISGIFIFKMLIVAAGIINSIILHISMTEDLLIKADKGAKPPMRIRIFAVISLILWPAALLMGRLIAYF